MTSNTDKDVLIEELKAALVRRELRINELELALYYKNNETASSDNELVGGACVLNMEASTGVYSDGWLADEATLVFGRGGEISLTFFLPPVEGGSDKRLTVHPNFGGSVALDVKRDVGVDYHLVIPPGIKQPIVNVRCDYPERVADDRRLGVIVV